MRVHALWFSDVMEILLNPIMVKLGCIEHKVIIVNY